MAAKAMPIMALDKQEAKLLAEGIQDVSQHYSVSIDPKTLAWLNFAGVLFAVYGSRIMVVWAGKGKKAAHGNGPVAASHNPQTDNAPVVFDPSQLTPIPGAFDSPSHTH